MKTKFAIMFLVTIFSFCGLSGNIPPDENINFEEEIIETTVNENHIHEIVYDERNEVNIPILMYHHITPDANIVRSDMTITPERFEEHIVDLFAMGYTPVFLEELISFVESGEKLPEKPICITFDDGYLSNYEYAFPILKKYNTKANIAVIGATIGATEYKDTKYKMIPHFTKEQAKEMEESGLISIISHTYDMHQAEHLESGDKIRVTAMKLKNETEEEYKIALTEDFEKISEILLENFEKETEIVAYPMR